MRGVKPLAVERRKDNKKRVLKEGEYQRANGTFEYKWRDRRGKRHSVYAKTLAELREKELNVLRDVLDGIRPENCKLTINDLYEAWVRLKRGLKDNTFQNYQYLYRQYVQPIFGLSKIVDLKRSDVRAFYNRLKDEEHLKTSTIDSIHTVLHQVLELGVEDGYIRYNPSDNALNELKRAHANDTVKRKALTLKEQEIFENFLRQPGEFNKWYPVFTVMLWTGMRVGEVTGLRWCDIDLEEEKIDINHTLVYYDKGPQKGLGFSVNTPKSKKGRRIIDMLPQVKEAFLQEKRNQEEFGIKCTVTIDGYTDFIFINRYGGTQHQGTLNKALRRIIRDCNYALLDANGGDSAGLVLLPKFSNHSLRHTFTTRMCEAGLKVKAMQDILGHSDSRTTMDIYAEATPDLKREEMQRLGEYFSREPDQT